MSGKTLSAALIMCLLTTSASADETLRHAISTPWLEEQDIKPQVLSPESAEVLFPDSTSAVEPDEESAIESYYNSRLNDQKLEQYGYDIFDKPAPDYDSPLGAVQDDYVLNIGDKLKISFTGQRNDQKEYIIGPQGTVFISDFAPISAAGRTIADVRAEISKTAESQLNLQAYVSLASIGQIGVLIVGEVDKPGRYNLTGFHSALDALIIAGGIKKDGSLRKIKIIRQGRGSTLDLYELFQNGDFSASFNLRDGDRIIVPPIGPTIGISGDVKRSGIYEIRETSDPMTGKHGSEHLSLVRAIAMGGGLISPQESNRYLMLKEDPRTGRDISQMIQDPNKAVLENASILIVKRALSQRSGTVEVKGHSNLAGLYDLSYNKNLSSLIGSAENLKLDTYPLIGIIERKDKTHFSTQFISFSIRGVLKNSDDVVLQESDIIHLFSNEDIDQILRINNNDTSNIKHGVLEDKNWQNTDLHSYLNQQVIYIRGGVKKPGLYPIAEGVTLADIIATAGGLLNEADPHNIEVSSTTPVPKRMNIDLHEIDPDSITLHVGDTIRFNKHHHKIARQTVTLYGEVRSPGEYDLLPGDKMSDLLKRAGGLTEAAYPAGAIFSRGSERKAEEARYKAMAQEIKRSLAASLQSDKEKPNATQIQTVQNLASELEHAKGLGRITVETNPSVLGYRPELDILLESGDKIFIPKRPLTVRVSGEVLSPAVLQFRKEKDPIDYIHEAGSFSYYADKGRAFVMFPDGSSKPLKANVWKHDPVFIPPGSTIIVPRDPKPFDFIESARDVTQILSNLAITSVLIDDLRD
ncbi:MAG: SLBB domain-containing protein [Alphaproteobacteria bacterium]|nr:SLBB domain-containing protein [Alphaproteobacteria bacterium]